MPGCLLSSHCSEAGRGLVERGVRLLPGLSGQPPPYFPWPPWLPSFKVGPLLLHYPFVPMFLLAGFYSSLSQQDLHLPGDRDSPCLVLSCTSMPSTVPGTQQALCEQMSEAHFVVFTSPPCGSLFRGDTSTPIKYLFKNLATLASVSPVWTRGTTLEREDIRRH